MHAYTFRVVSHEGETMSAVYSNMGNGANPVKPLRLLDRMRQLLRAKHYAYSTEQTYVHWARRYIFFIPSAIRKRWAAQESNGF